MPGGIAFDFYTPNYSAQVFGNIITNVYFSAIYFQTSKLQPKS